MGILSFGIVLLLREPASAQDDLPTQTTKSLKEIEPEKPSLDHLEDSRYD
jgi:hypothetical protein